MPPEALALALAASIYPPAVAAIIALGRGAQVRSRVAMFVFASLAVTYAGGVVALFVLVELGVTGSHSFTPSAAFDLVLGVALLGLAVYLSCRRPRGEKHQGSSKIDRYLESRGLAFMLGLTLYVIPSPIYLAAVKEVADAKLSTGGELAALAVTVFVMLWLIEVPMVMLLAVPDRAVELLERINRWFARNGRVVAVAAAAAAGAYLAIDGLANLIG